MFTYDDEFKHIAKYMDIYELLLTNGPMHLDEIKKALIEAGVPETSARRNAADFWYSDSELIWSDDNDRKYINLDISKYFIYELADALNVVIYGEALMQEIEDKYKEREHAETISRNRMICFKDKTMYDWNFDHDDGTVPLMKLAKRYVDSFPEMIHKSAGLLLWGDVGTGKTYMAACIANPLIEQEYAVKMTNFATIINDLFASEDKNEYIECLMRCSLLIIDDLGAERSTEYAVENVFNVIDRRYRTGEPLIITTNLHIDTMRNETTIDKKRIYDRVFEMCVPVQMKGVSKRKMSADSKIKLLRELNNRED